MIQIIYLIPALILFIVLFLAVSSLKNTNQLLTKRIDEKELKVKDLEKKLKNTEENLGKLEKEKSELFNQIGQISEQLSEQKGLIEKYKKSNEKPQNTKLQKEEDVIIEYYLKTKK